MSALTVKQEKFCQAVANGMTQADAYRSAFNASNMKDATIWKRASELMVNGAVAGRVAQLRENLEKKALWTREMSVKALVTAYKEGNAAAKVSAVRELNLMHGFNEPQKIQLSGDAGVRIYLPDNGRDRKPD